MSNGNTQEEKREYKFGEHILEDMDRYLPWASDDVPLHMVANKLYIVMQLERLNQNMETIIKVLRGIRSDRR